MFKKACIGLIYILLICGIVAAFRLVRTEDAQTASQMATVNAQTATYRHEITELRERIEDIRQGKEDSEFNPTRIVYGFYADSPEKIQDTGAIVLDAGADAQLVREAQKTGREILYFFDPDQTVPSSGAAVVLRAQNDTRENQAMITGVISRHVDNASAGVSETGQVNIPYVYVKSDEIDVSERLANSRDALLVIFNPEATTGYSILKSAFDEGTLLESTVSETVEYLMENQISEEERTARNEEYIAELQARIDELQQQIDAIYDESKEKRSAEKGLFGFIGR